MVSQLIPFLTASVLLTISPGPDIIYVLVQSISNGRKAGILTTLGLASGIIIHTALVALGVSVILKESENLFFLIKMLGAFYLFFLSYKAYLSKAVIAMNPSARKERLSSLFYQGFIMNILNPKVTIFFLAFFPGFLWDPTENISYQFFFLGSLFMLQTIIIFALVAFLAGRITSYLQKYPSLGGVLKWVQVVVFVVIGIFIMFG